MSFNNIPIKLKQIHFNIATAETKELQKVFALQLKDYIENHVIPTIELVYYCESLINNN